MSELHFVRMREKDSDRFVDPEALIQQVFRQAVTAALSIAEQSEAKDELASIFYVFYVHLEEDTRSLADQMTEFHKAMDRVAEKYPKFVTMFLINIAYYMLYMFAMYTRRDSKTDKLDRVQIFTAGLYELVRPYLTSYCHALMKSELKDQLKPLTEPGIDKTSMVYAVCQETGERIDDIKQFAARVFTDGDMDWNEAAAACDAFCNEDVHKAGLDDTKTGVAAAMAYPTYSNPTHSVTVTEGDSNETSEQGDNETKTEQGQGSC